MECLSPIFVKTKTARIPVPCGKCPSCTARRASGWSFRLMQQELKSKSAHFITLTYDTKFVPITNSGRLSVDLRDLQLFFKRLRKHHGPPGFNKARPIKYYACAEYGGKTWRPHYHILLFNAFEADVIRSWPFGRVHFGTVTGASVAYSLKYMSKRGKIPAFDGDDRTKEFGVMSKGIGINYLTENMRAWHKQDANNRMYLNSDGKKVGMPRYYKEKLYDEFEREMIGFATRCKMLDEQNKEFRKVKDKDLYFWRKEQARYQAFKKAAKVPRGTI